MKVFWTVLAIAGLIAFVILGVKAKTPDCGCDKTKE